MCTSVVFSGPRRRAQGGSASDREVLTGLLMTSPVPINDLLSQCGHVGAVELIVCLLQSWPFFWARVEGWTIVWFFRRWQRLEDLLSSPEGVNMHCPDLCDLAS